MTIRRKKSGNRGRGKEETTRERILRRYAELKNERGSWERAWKTILEQILPYRSRFDSGKHNDGTPLTTNIINGTPAEALKVLCAGLMSGVTSPAKKWFRLVVDDDELMDDDDVKEYLEEVEKVLLTAFDRFGFYSAVSSGVYPDLGTVGTAVLMEEEDEEDGTPVFESAPVGSWYLACDKRGRVDTYYRERTFSVRQMVDKFGFDKCSTLVRDNFTSGQLAKTVDVLHCIYPNTDYESDAVGVKGMRWSSVWVEVKGDEDSLLREGGYYEFPVLAPRWNVRSGDSYGRGPGWFAVSDCLALQHLQKKLARMVDKTADPPMVGIDTMKTKRASLLPGDVTYVPAGQTNAFEPAMEIKAQSIAVLREYIQDHELRIKDCFYYRLWMTLLNDPRNQRPTATEVEATRQEVMLQLGPVLENLNSELLSPLIDRTLAILQRGRHLPEMPEELGGSVLRVKFISVMHMAQHMVGISAIREVENHVFGLLQAGAEEALMKLDVPKLVDEVADMAGAPRKILRSQEEVEEMQAELAAQQKAQQDGEAALRASEGVRNIGNVDPQSVSDVMAQLGPVVQAQGGR